MKTVTSYININKAAAEAKAEQAAFNEAKRVILTAGMQNRWMGVWVLRKYTQSPQQVARLVEYAESNGVEVRGQLSFSEAREFTMAAGSMTAKAMGLR